MQIMQPKQKHKNNYDSWTPNPSLFCSKDARSKPNPSTNELRSSSQGWITSNGDPGDSVFVFSDVVHLKRIKKHNVDVI